MKDNYVKSAILFYMQADFRKYRNIKIGNSHSEYNNGMGSVTLKILVAELGMPASSIEESLVCLLQEGHIEKYGSEYTLTDSGIYAFNTEEI
jgi:predicted transcriptional regulator